MKYRYLGNSGLLVSTLSFGSWMAANALPDEDTAFAILAHAFKLGINYFDNAEIYALGQAETLMGKCIQRGIDTGVWTREDLVVSTKIFWGTKFFGSDDVGPNDIGLSRKHILEGTKASLKRLKLDYVDLIFCHRPDPYTPIEETVRAMNYVIDQGWAFYWGTSEWNAYDIMKACEVADRLGLARPVFDQAEYHLLERSRVDFDFVNLYTKYKYGLTTWSPLASGILTGKYANGIPEGSRMANPLFKGLITDFDGKVATAAKLESVAKEIGATLTQFALAWIVANKNVSTVILGATSTKQLDENVTSLAFVDKITPEIRAKVDAIVAFVPKVVEQAEPFVHLQRTKHL
jgi:voltage-dependent potassium channel beta subunit